MPDRDPDDPDGRPLAPPAGAESGSVRRFVPVTVLVPLLGAVLGVDGGPIFQVLAVEDLGLGAAAIGVAFGLGVVSLPVQVLAARTPLRRARRNVQWFLAIAATQAWLLAALVAVGATDGLAAVALGVTVAAEVALSVLFATAWQPLLSSSVPSAARQRLNATWPGVARGVLAGALVLFAALGRPARAVFLVAVGVLALVAALGLNRVDSPVRPDDDADDGAGSPRPTGQEPLSGALRLVFVVVGVVNLGALPLWLVYLDEVLWPTANLGLVAACQTAASTVALLAWRPTDAGGLGRRRPRRSPSVPRRSSPRPTPRWRAAPPRRRRSWRPC